MAPATLESKIEKQGDELVINYSITNNLNERLFVLDQTIQFGATQGLEIAPESAMVLLGPVIRVVKGFVQPNSLPMVLIMPGARGIDPGESLSGVIRIKTPLKTWHPNESQGIAIADYSQIQLEIGTLAGDITWRRQPLVDGGFATTPTKSDISKQVFVKSEIFTVP